MRRTLGQPGHEIPAAQGFFVEHRDKALTNVGARGRSLAQLGIQRLEDQVSAAPASPTSPGSTSSLEYTRGPEPRSTKVLLITVVVIAMVLALAAASWVWSALGGVAHSTVSAARAKAIPTVEGDVERIVTVLAPTRADLHSAPW
jgi:hypothetical protein